MTDLGDIRSVADLIALANEEHLPKFLCFWRPDPRPDGVLGAECMSQWHRAGFEIDGTRYASAEHWMMAEKARLFGDERIRARIIDCDHPGEARRLGREVRGFDENAWQRARSEIVIVGNVAKFTQNDELTTFLRASSARVLVEASPRDRIWGIGLEAKDPRSRDPRAWLGQNLLGFALMEARRRIG